VEENNEVNIPKRYHRRYRESKTNTNNQWLNKLIMEHKYSIIK
jgi:hypothetical protein